MTTLAYQGTMTKADTLAQLAAHRAADQIVQGYYWQGNGEFKGCAVGCLTHNPAGGHTQFPERWGVPVQLAYLIDHIFESLADDAAVAWPERIMSAIPEGADLSRVYDQWCAWMLARLVSKMPDDLPSDVRASVEVMASLFERAGAGAEVADDEWSEAARAAWAAWAAGAAGAAWAAWAARAAGAAWAAWAAEAAARNEWAIAAADELVRLVEAA